MNTRVLVRGAADVLRRSEVVPPTRPGTIQDLSRAVRALGSSTWKSPPGRNRPAFAPWKRGWHDGDPQGAVTISWRARARRPGPLHVCGPAPQHRHEPGRGPHGPGRSSIPELRRTLKHTAAEVERPCWPSKARWRGTRGRRFSLVFTNTASRVVEHDGYRLRCGAAMHIKFAL